MQKIIILLALITFTANAQKQFKHPEGPSQQCRDDAGSPWGDDSPNYRYFDGYAFKANLNKGGKCPTPLAKACEDKGVIAAYHDGPVDCGGRGWFCIIEDQPGHRMPERGIKNGKFPDANFAFCDQKDFEHDRDGHCHGSDVADTYGWWVRDHWHRNYAGKIRCCCGWGNADRGGQMDGYVNRCDYRKHVTPKVLPKCRDANEEHKVDWHSNCEKLTKPDPAQCWSWTGFGPANLDGPPDNENDENEEEDDDEEEKVLECSDFRKPRKCKKRGGCQWDKKEKQCSKKQAKVNCASIKKKRKCKKNKLCTFVPFMGCQNNPQRRY